MIDIGREREREPLVDPVWTSSTRLVWTVRLRALCRRVNFFNKFPVLCRVGNKRQGDKISFIFK